MWKLLLILYIVCFGCYLLFTREPDFFDGECTKAKTHWIKDSLSNSQLPFAMYSIDGKLYQIKVNYLGAKPAEREELTLIYNASKPTQSAVYKLWGYWLTSTDIYLSIGLITVLFVISKLITSNPTPESVLEQLEDDAPAPRKYS